MSALAVTGLALLALAVAGTVFQAVGSVRSARRFLPPGQFVDVGDHRLHTVCSGHGTPTVVLESAIAASSLSWTRVQPEVARFASVCAYDRAGLAFSDAATASRTTARIIDDLHALLTRLERAESCVMVGHSFGVFVCLAYAARYPDQVAGLVLVDPPSEWVQMDERQARLLLGGVYLSRLGGLLARLGIVRACLTLLTGGLPAAPRHFVKLFGPTTARTLERMVGEVRKLPPDIQPVVQAMWCQPKCFRAMADYLRVLPEAALAASRLDLHDDVPLVVISSGDQTPAVIAMHQALARMSSQGRHLIASNSHHWVQFDEPELVVETIREVVDAVRRRAPARDPSGGANPGSHTTPIANRD
jgi:pimeloyl-ACP methyl ester carboxylesterase